PEPRRPPACRGWFRRALTQVTPHQSPFVRSYSNGTYLVAEAVFARAIESSPRLSLGSCPAAADVSAAARTTRASNSSQFGRPGRLRHGPGTPGGGRGGFAR